MNLWGFLLVLLQSSSWSSGGASEDTFKFVLKTWLRKASRGMEQTVFHTESWDEQVGHDISF